MKARVYHDHWAVRPTLVPITLGLAVLMTADSAQAQPTEGERLFAEGRELMAAGDLQAACDRFEASYEKEEALAALLNLAECDEKRGRRRVALNRWRHAADKADTDRTRVFALGRAADLERRMPKILVKVEGQRAAAANVRIDGRPAAVNVAVAVDPGEHNVQVTAEGESWQGGLTVTDDSATSEILAFPPAPPEPPSTTPVLPPASPNPQPTGSQIDWSAAAWASMAIGVVGAGIFAGTGVAILDQCSGEIGGKSHVCVDDQGRPTDRPDALLGANVAGFVGGLVGIGLGTTFFVLSATQKDEVAVRVESHASPFAGALVVSGTF